MDPDDHDLVLVSHAGDKAKFEVSDVAGKQDTNRKEQKDLTSLGVLQPSSSLGDAVWPSGRLFLVVSAEFAEHLRGSRLRNGRTYAYTELKQDGATRIFEVEPNLTP